MGGCQSQDARNAAIDSNFPADSRHVMMKVTSDKDMNKMQDTDSSQREYKARTGYQPKPAYKPRSSPPATANGMSAILEKKRAEQAQQQQPSARTMTNSDDEKDRSDPATDGTPDAERRDTEKTAAAALDWSNSSKD
mmetsp:Transcript_12308/g.35203  ORF Transcript_12308/g.35203 Transcript_12308/m.35203 type:complete len:137 (+) Transcript_12308:276-686(+)|eukprot:CAMPEP_0181043222 /NCGR_PEP_ID=MMETSP1070-20121207/12588_1 /TAXON_ID=265543 /ORGANISM="Minutocellus polymorphus, Strain NH13" /LENGTH=136 /DNA_ID=CAMNT_0023121527 /DNA_START=267 /DNA_END=677 /DNA_ORIENTATION=-